MFRLLPRHRGGASTKNLLARVVAKTKALSVGDVRDPRNTIGAVIGTGAQKKDPLEYGRGGPQGRQGRWPAASPGPAERRLFRVADRRGRHQSPHHRLAQEEIFGPAPAVIPVKELSRKAIQVANGTEYGLTGSPLLRGTGRDWSGGKRELFCGNLYLNRKCTGAYVERIPSAASTCPAPIPRPAAASTSTSSPRQRPSRRSSDGSPHAEAYMTRGSYPTPADRFLSVGYSEIVNVRNRVDLLAAGEMVWRFEGGEPYCAPAQIKDAMTRALQRNHTRYAPSSGIPELRTAIVAKVARRNGIPADKDSPIVVNGGMHGLFAAFATLLNPGDEVLLFSPYWTPIVDVVTYHGAKPVPGPHGHRPPEGSLPDPEKSVTPRTKVLYWNSPVNPTGEVFTRAEVEEISRFVFEHGLAVISDEAYEDLIYEREGHVSPVAAAWRSGPSPSSRSRKPFR